MFSHVPEMEFDRLHLDRLMYQFWKRDSVEAECERIHQTWFDYRHIHPVQRSFVFVKEYELSYQRAYKRFLGKPKNEGEDLPLYGRMKPLYRRSPHAMRTVILKMHLIDELGCPYDTYFDAAFNHMMQDRGYMEYWKQHEAFGHHDLPPIQVLADARTLISSQKTFEQKNAIKLRIPKHAHYFADRWIGDKNQQDCARHLIATVQNRGDRNHVLARLVYEFGLLRENEIVRHLDLKVVKNIRSIRDRDLNQC